MDMDKMIKAFDVLIADSEKKGISIYENQGIEHFIIQCQEELRMPEAYEILKAHIKLNEDVFLERMGDENEKVPTIDIAILKLRHFILEKHNKDALYRIQVVQKTNPEA